MRADCRNSKGERRSVTFSEADVIQKRGIRGFITTRTYVRTYILVKWRLFLSCVMKYVWPWGAPPPHPQYPQAAPTYRGRLSCQKWEEMSCLAGRRGKIRSFDTLYKVEATCHWMVELVACSPASVPETGKENERQSLNKEAELCVLISDLLIKLYPLNRV